MPISVPSYSGICCPFRLYQIGKIRLLPFQKITVLTQHAFLSSRMSLFQSSFSPSASAFIIINVSLGGYASNHHMRMDKPLASSKNDPCFFLAKFGAYTILLLSHPSVDSYDYPERKHDIQTNSISTWQWSLTL